MNAHTSTAILLTTAEPSDRNSTSVDRPRFGSQPGLLKTMYQARVERAETRATTLAEILKNDAGRERRAIAALGASHCQQGMGTPSRVRSRIPGITDRIIVMSQSGEVELSEAEKKLASDVGITHAQLGHLQAPLADYLHIVSRKR